MRDVHSLASLTNNPSVSRYLLKVPYPYTDKEARRFIAHCQKGERKKNRSEYVFAIESKVPKQVLGIISLTEVDQYQGTAVLGYWLGQSYWRRGIMYEACRRVLSFAFNVLKLRRINASVSARNRASNNLIKKLGFAYEGTRRRAHRTKATGQIDDTHIYGLLRDG